MKRLLILSFSPIASDARVLKQVKAFSTRYDVVTCGYGPAPEGVTAHFALPDDAPVWRYSRPALILRQYGYAYRNNKAVAAARAALAGQQFDAVLADDVDAVPLALELKPRLGVHADLHEYSPRMHEEDWKFRWFVRPFIEWNLRTFVRRASSWTTVGQGIAEEYQRRFGFRPNVVTNAAPYVDAAAQPVGDVIKLVHSGAALRARNIDAIVNAVTATTAPVTLDMYLTPNDPGYLEELRRLAHASNGKITLHDPVPYAELSQTLNRYDIGVHLLPAVNFNNLWALPNKLFDYVQARLGVIIGPSPEMKRVVEEHGIGIVADGFTSVDLQKVLENDITGARVMSFKNASDASARELSSDTQVAIWVQAIDDLMARG